MPKDQLTEALVVFRSSIRSVEGDLASIKRSISDLGERLQRIDNDRAFWRSPTSYVSMAGPFLALAGLITTWVSMHHQSKSVDLRLKGVEDGIRILAINQGLNVQFAVEKALDAKVILPPPQIEQAKETAELLARVSPNSSETWKTIASVANYRSEAFSPTPFEQPQLPPCKEGMHAGGSFMRADIAQRLMRGGDELSGRFDLYS